VVPFDRLGMVSYQCSVFYSNFIPKTHRFGIFNLLLYSDLEILVMGHSRSSEPTRIDPPPMTSY